MKLTNEQIEEIRDLLNESHDVAYSMQCMFEGSKYTLEEEEEGNWIDEGKYQYGRTIFQLVKNNELLNVYFAQDITRSGSYFSDYYYDYEPIQRVVREKETIVRQVWKEI